MSLNLASRPFVNRRPIQRIAIFLWVLVGLLVLVDGIFYLDYFRGSGRQTRERFLELQSEIRAETRRVEELEMELSGFDPEGQAEHVIFLNERISERSFGWSRLFDRLVDVLPRKARLTKLQPRRSDVRDRSLEGRDDVRLSLLGQAESGDALYQLVDQLYAHPAFEDPELSNEFQQDGSISFTLSVVYVPGAADPEPAEGDESAGTQGELAVDESQDLAPDTEESSS